MIYLNNAGTSWPKPPEVLRVCAEILAAAPSEALPRWEAAHAEVAALLGLEPAGRLLLTPSCTAALAAAIGDLPWRAAEVVLTSALEHHALLRPVADLVAHRGVEHAVAPYSSEAPVDLDFVRARLARGGVRLVAMTGVSNVTGECLPVAELAALAHEHGALFLLDAAQWIGVLPFDPAALGVDLVAFAGHKGPLGPQGVGGLWAAPGVEFETTDRLEPATARFSMKRAPSYCDTGSAGLAAGVGLATGLRASLHGEHAGEVARSLATAARSELRSRPQCRVFGGESNRYGATVALSLAGLSPADAETRLRARGIEVRGGQHCAPSACAAVGAPEGVLRVSFGPANRSEDVSALLEAIDEITEAP